MNTHLTSLTNFPLNQPYSVAPWNYPGTESVITIPADVVDWVIVELRDAPDAVSADPASYVAKQAAFVLDNGSVVDGWYLHFII